MPGLYSRLPCIVTLVICSGLVIGCVSAAETDPDGRQFQPSADPLSDVKQALGRADDGDKDVQLLFPEYPLLSRESE